jgi:chitinase
MVMGRAVSRGTAVLVVLLSAGGAACDGAATREDGGVPLADDGSSGDGVVEADVAPDTDAGADAGEDVDTVGDGEGDGAEGADGADATDGGAAPVWVMGYYVGYQRDAYPPDVVQYDAMTHLAVGAVVPRADGTLDTTFWLDATSGPAMADDLVTRAHAAGVSAILMVGGAGAHEGFVGACGDAARRATLVANLVRWARDEHRFDGLDLDWEPLPEADHASFRALAEALRAAWPEAVLTVPVGYLNVNYETADPFFGEIAPLFDRINVMSYAMTGTYGGWQSWHSAALYGEGPTTPTSIDGSVERYLEAGVPAAKLGIGIGFFGACYTPPVSGPKQDLRGSTIAAMDNDISYRNVVTRYFDAAARRWDAEARVPYLSFAAATGPMGCGFLSYEDAESIAERARYVEARGLGGAIVWAINEGYLPASPAGERDPLMDALRVEFLHR